MYIFGVKIEKNSKKDILNKCFNALNKGKNGTPLFVVTLNPEILLTARENSKYREIIDSFRLKIVDGVGLKLVSWLKKKKISDRISGADLAEILIDKAQKLNLKIGIIFDKNGLSSEEKIGQYFKSFKNITLLGIDKEQTAHDFKILAESKLILVATGHPHQEKLIHRHIAKLPEVKLAIGIGGTLDFWARTKKRAPKVIQKLGLEWAWRLLVQPNRYKRIFNATVIFPFLAIFKNKSQ